MRRLGFSKATVLHALEWGAAVTLVSTPHLGWRMVACGLVAAVSIHRMGRALARVDLQPGAGEDEPAAEPDAAEPPPAPKSRRGSVLLAEDDPDNQALFAIQLRRAGYTVTIAANGRAAVDLATASMRSGEPFDVIYMDMAMPELDGYAATREVRARGYEGMIVALTAHCVPGDREKCLDAGCDDYRAKPIDRTNLLDTTRDYVSRAHATLGNADTCARRVEMPPSNEPLVSELAGDADMADILAEFVRILGTRAAMLAAALGRGDRETVQRVVHQLKGAAGGYGFPSITLQAKAVEDAMAIAGDGAELEDAVRALCSMCLRARYSADMAGDAAA